MVLYLDMTIQKHLYKAVNLLQYRALDKNGDYTLGQNDIKQGKEAVAQAIKTRLALLYGQWWENTEDGLPLFEKILGSYGNHKEMIDMLITERIADTKDVKEIKSYTSTFQNRVYSANCIVETIYGTISVDIGKVQ